jgi:hypothetical protein
MAWVAAQPLGRFTFTFTPTHGSWLNLIEGFFSKVARSLQRGSGNNQVIFWQHEANPSPGIAARKYSGEDQVVKIKR